MLKTFSQSFQSTPPRRGRHLDAFSKKRYFTVSIHAPAQGATAAVALVLSYNSFNPRPRAGGDLRQPTSTAQGTRFNPRPRAGGDRMQGAIYLPLSMFQSTPPRRGRLSGLYPHPLRHRVSIHAPAQGATSKSLDTFTPYNMFQSTPPRRGRPHPPCIHFLNIIVSIHAPAQGATALPFQSPWNTTFQSTPPRRGRLHIELFS